MNHNTKIQKLKSEGLSPNLLNTLTEAQITSLFNRLLESKKKEQKEETKSTVTKYTYDPSNPTDQKTLSQKGIHIDPASKKITMTEDNEDAEFDAMTIGIDQDKIQKPGSDYPGSDRSKDTLDEKFESKAQQGLFWARCNKCKTDDCKWCKMAKEFSKSTSKKQYKNMPEKKHPEKTVKYKKKETKEGYMDNVGKKVTDTYAKKFASFTPGLAWGGMKENYDKIIEKYTEPTMKKRELLKLIENQIKNKKPLNESFYFDGEMDEDFDIMSRYEEDDEDYKEYGMPPGREEPGMPPGREDDDTPRPRNKMSRLSRRMNDPFAPTIEPGIKEPKIKPIEPDRAPEWEPDFDEPIVPDEDTETEPQARDKRNKDFMRSIREEFNRSLNKLDNVSHKPIKYRKY